MSAKDTKSISPESPTIFLRKPIVARLVDGSNIYAKEFRKTEDYLVVRYFKFSFIDGTEAKTYRSTDDEEYMIHNDAIMVSFVSHKGKENEEVSENSNVTPTPPQHVQ
jgi:hypothetical protein